jgi:drug/metabolite transporter (DMT)-like permease
MNVSKRMFILLLSIMTILFGLSFIATKQALQGLGIFQVVFCRHVLALIFLTLILWRERQKFYIPRKDLKHFLLLTLVEPVGYFIFETIGLRYSTPSNVSIIIATIPIFSLLFAWWILKEKIHLPAVAGITFSLLGVYLVVAASAGSEFAPRPLLGNLFTVGASVSAGLYNVLCRRLGQTYSPWTITYYQSIVASLVFLPLAVAEYFLLPDIQVTGEIFFSILYLALGSSVIAYLILNFSLSKLPTQQVAIFANLVPVVTVLASWIFYKEFLETRQLIGALLVILGIYLTYLRVKK